MNYLRQADKLSKNEFIFFIDAGGVLNSLIPIRIALGIIPFGHEKS